MLFLLLVCCVCLDLLVLHVFLCPVISLLPFRHIFIPSFLTLLFGLRCADCVVGFVLSPVIIQVSAALSFCCCVDIAVSAGLHLACCVQTGPVRWPEVGVRVTRGASWKWGVTLFLSICLSVFVL